MIDSVSVDEVRYAEGANKFEAGTPAILEAIGFGAAAEWLMAQDREAVAAHEHAVYARAAERLRGENWLRVVGDSPDKGAILTFAVEGAHAHDVAQVLDRYGVAVRAGTHCAEPLMRRFGLTSSARASFALYNTLDEADAFRRRPSAGKGVLPVMDDAAAPQRDVLHTAPAAAGEASAIPQAELDRLTDDLIGALKSVFDPEIPVDIYELGLIYKVDVSDDRDVIVEMTLTAPGCPVAGDMPGWVQEAVVKVEGVRSCHVDLTFDPPWDPTKMSDEAKLQLNMF